MSFRVKVICSLEAGEFAKAIEEADFDLLMQEDIHQFLDFVREEVVEGKEQVVVRCALETTEENIELPYYVWLVYEVQKKGDFLGLSAKQFYVPNSKDPQSYYSIPDRLKGEKFFHVVIEE